MLCNYNKMRCRVVRSFVHSPGNWVIFLGIEHPFPGTTPSPLETFVRASDRRLESRSVGTSGFLSYSDRKQAKRPAGNSHFLGFGVCVTRFLANAASMGLRREGDALNTRWPRAPFSCTDRNSMHPDPGGGAVHRTSTPAFGWP